MKLIIKWNHYDTTHSHLQLYTQIHVFKGRDPFWPHQYGVPMKDIRRASVAVIWAEIPKSATQQGNKSINNNYI